MTPSSLTELAARVEAGSVLLNDVLKGVGWRYVTGDGDLQPYWRYPDGSLFRPGDQFPALLTSLDAVVALIAERLPGRRTFLQNPDGYIRGAYQGERRAVVFFDPPSPYSSAMSDEDIVGVASSPARAMLAATLRALAAQQQDRPTEGDSNG